MADMFDGLLLQPDGDEDDENRRSKNRTGDLTFESLGGSFEGGSDFFGGGLIFRAGVYY